MTYYGLAMLYPDGTADACIHNRRTKPSLDGWQVLHGFVFTHPGFHRRAECAEWCGPCKLVLKAQRPQPGPGPGPRGAT